jgi:hypothetical protein
MISKLSVWSILRYGAASLFHGLETTRTVPGEIGTLGKRGKGERGGGTGGKPRREGNFRDINRPGNCLESGNTFSNGPTL